MQVNHLDILDKNRSLTKYSSNFKLQEDKSSWTKIDVTTNKMLTKYITIKGEDVFASKPYKDLKVCVDCTLSFNFSLNTFYRDYHKSTYPSCRLKVATAFSRTRVIQGYLPTTQCQTASWSAPGRLVTVRDISFYSSNDAAKKLGLDQVCSN